MAPIKKKTNDENNIDAVEFDYGDPAEWFNWICIVCKHKALDGLSLEMQFLGDNVIYQDSDGSVWFRCEKCATSIHQNCLGFNADQELLKKFGLVVKCC